MPLPAVNSKALNGPFNKRGGGIDSLKKERKVGLTFPYITVQYVPCTVQYSRRASRPFLLSSSSIPFLIDSRACRDGLKAGDVTQEEGEGEGCMACPPHPITKVSANTHIHIHLANMTTNPGQCYSISIVRGRRRKSIA